MTPEEKVKEYIERADKLLKQIEIEPNTLKFDILVGVAKMLQKEEHFNNTVEEKPTFSTIREQIDNFKKIADKRGITNCYIDSDIFDWLPNAEVSKEKAPQGTFTPVDTVNGTTEGTMLQTAEQMTLSQAIQYFTDELEAGTFDALETYRIIFLTDTRDSDGKALELYCYRSSDGKLSLSVNEVVLGNSWYDAGFAWLATNS